MVINLSIVSTICPIENINKVNFEYARNSYFKYLLLRAAKSGDQVYENEVNRINNLKYARTLNKQITIQEVFRDNWDDFKEWCKSKKKHLRSSILINVQKMIDCKDLSKGHLFFECPNCNNFYVQGLSCHSRFCVSCGKKYRDARANEIAKTCIHVPHRHITWTISGKLRDFFQRHRDLYNELFAAVNDVLTFLIHNKSKAAKKRNERLGFISTLHTFGRDIKHNPHIHTLVAECTIDNTGKRKPYNYFNYESLRKSFMKQILDRMYKYFKSNNFDDELNEFKKVRTWLYKNVDNGFYVHAPQTECKNPNQIKRIVNYVCRYAGHPAMSESRILKYDYSNKLIHYYYDPHEDDAIINENDKVGRQYVTEHIFEFIAKLIVHIPEESVHTTRYYGFYANHSSLDTKHQYKLFKLTEINEMNKLLNWRFRLLSSYKYDPLICHCGTTMVFVPDQCFFPGYTKEAG